MQLADVVDVCGEEVMDFTEGMHEKLVLGSLSKGLCKYWSDWRQDVLRFWLEVREAKYLSAHHTRQQARLEEFWEEDNPEHFTETGDWVNTPLIEREFVAILYDIYRENARRRRYLRQLVNTEETRRRPYLTDIDDYHENIRNGTRAHA